MIGGSTRAWRHLRIAIIAVSAGCSHDSPGPSGPSGPGQGEPPSPLYVSNASSLSSAGSISPRYARNPGVGAAASITVADANVAYISLQPQTYPSGTNAVISNRRSGAAVKTSMVDGGFDPVPLPASEGDSASIEIKTTDGITIATVSSSVPSRRAPKIVRTIPGRGKTGVPLNKNIEVVFTEPVTQSSLFSSIKLLRGNAEVPGSATILQGVTAGVVFNPDANLAANANYELVVTNGVLDLDGDPVDSIVRVSFTTGTSIEGPVASLSLIPEGAAIRAGDQFQAVVVARDAAGNELTGHAVKWSADSSAVEVTSTGLVTGRREGFGMIRAEVDGLMGAMGVGVSNALAQAGSVVLAFDSGSVAAGGAFQVAAIAYDAAGNLLPYRLVQWSTTNAAVATVAATGAPAQADISRAWFNGFVPPPQAIYWANVTGVANGVARIIAMIDGRSDTVVVTVAAALPVVGFFVLPDTATLLLHQSMQSVGFNINSAGGRTSILGTQIQWESSNPAVASVDVNGIVAGSAAGSAVITGHWNNYSASTRVTVVEVAFESMSAGYTHTCAIATGGATYCWGANESGQLGRPFLVGFPVLANVYPTPTRVAEEFAFVAISAGYSHTCALTAAGAVYCWGAGSGLWTGSPEDSWRPLPVPGGLTFATIRAGNYHTCGLTTAGAAYCWGSNVDGQLGTSGRPSSAVPLPVSGGITFADLTTNDGHSCGITIDGNAYCWGYNGVGQLGVGPRFGTVLTPQLVSGGLSYTSITAGGAHTCGLTRSGFLYCWGSDFYDQLGTGTDRVASDVPVPVTGGLSFSAVAAGSFHTCAIDTGGAAHCWGWNLYGQTGAGNVADEVIATPQRVVGGLTFDRLTAGGSHNCARTTAGTWYCWGNESGLLGVGTNTNSGTPLKVLGQK
jgi:alpha-tubulin suppressor-like RCC1 family protein